ncbi:GNAT family N-acetyltransferase [Gluconobacter oxydans]|uniref:GNAT family N-acetyltransferase n=1 Tax=Gluconobacter oxydans TaxID=442 RepID=UPI0011DD78F1|nr:GNAT family N-acetyltransferase [Gluconobacter oxydans]
MLKKFWHKFFSNSSKNITEQEYIDNFKKSPQNFFFDYSGINYDFRKYISSLGNTKCLDDIYIKFGPKAVGWIEGIVVYDDRATIRHIGIEKSYLRRGLATHAISTAINNISREYNLTTFFFEESHRDFDNWPYNSFFLSMGAELADDRNNRIWKLKLD